MTLSIALAVGALLVGAVADLLYRVAQRRGIDAGVFLLWQSLIYSIAIWAFALVSGQTRQILGSTWLYGVPAGLLAYLGLYLFVVSLRTGDASVNAPVFRLNFVVTAAGAILLLKEPVNALKVAGILLAVVSVASLLNLRALRGNGPALRSMGTVVAGALLFGAVGVLAKAALNAGSHSIPLVLTQTVGFVAAAVVYVLPTRRWRPNGPTRRFVPVVALLQLAWALLAFQSLSLGDASIAFPIIQLSFVLTALLAVVFLRESATRAKFGGLALAVLAVGALALA
ncbi:MAG: DMT family transporter [Chloroflexi bacterium]|nr:DMT family transporter [Chloroflexota bacterium]